jgi:HK97 family phage prohead protease
MAAVYFDAGDPGTEYQLDQYGEVVERLAPGCFDRAVRECDVRCLFNHDPNYPLGRNVNGTLTLELAPKGLRYKCSLPDSPVGQTVRVALERGDVTGSSFSFVPVRVEWIAGEKGKPSVRLARDVDLFDVAPVVFPAYASASSCLGGRSACGGDRLPSRLSRDAVLARARCVQIEMGR